MLLALVLAAALETGSVAQAPLPRGWREPTKAELSEAAAVSREENKDVHREPGDRPYRDPVYELVADFDGDGREDRAVLLINDKTNAKGLFVKRAAKGRYEALDDGNGDRSLDYYDLDLLEPGEYVDITERDRDNPGIRVKISRPSIYIGYGESSSQTFYWNGQKFTTIWLTD